MLRNCIGDQIVFFCFFKSLPEHVFVIAVRELSQKCQVFLFFFACLCAHSTWPGSGGLFNVLEVLFFLRDARYLCYKPATTAGLLSLDEKTETNIALSRKANPSLRNTRTHVNLLIFFCTDILITPPSCSFVPVTLEEEFTRGGIVSPPHVLSCFSFYLSEACKPERCLPFKLYFR